jgi:hypothetical protein
MIADDLGSRSQDAQEGTDAIQAGKILIEMALTVDHVFAAELSRLCGTQVWKEVGPAVIDRLHSLYGVADGRYRHSALAGMLASGSDGFKDIIIPMLSGDSQQERLCACPLG